jgi:hypothetical protein
MSQQNGGEDRELLLGLVRRLGLRGFYELLGGIHAEAKGKSETPEEGEHALAEVGAQVALALLGMAARHEAEGAVWEQRGETYSDYIADEALELFWLIIAALVPQAKTGDLAPELDARLKQQARTAVWQWIIFNVTPEEAARLSGGG